MLIDDVTIEVHAGHGGKGAVAFNKNLMSLGPAGGSGGHGGSAYLEGVADLGALGHFRFKKTFEAESGKDGKGQFADGPDGRDVVLTVPVGTVIHNLGTGEDTEIVHVGQQFLAAQGGNGGKGNFHFRSSTNTTPKQFQPGLPGGKVRLRLELKLIADVGFIGLPNVGKSSLLNNLTHARSKVGNYAFTTLEPSLGAYYELILADLPGLIEGASSGKGLGIKFLRHVERTRILFHFISVESEDPVKDYKTVRAELGEYNPELLKKPEHIFLSKSDEVGKEIVAAKIKALKKLNGSILPVSIYDPEDLMNVKKLLNKIKDEKLGLAS